MPTSEITLTEPSSVRISQGGSTVHDVPISSSRTNNRTVTSTNATTTSTSWRQLPPLYSPNSQQLPVRNESGIILYFLHIPKTGGSTVAHPFRNQWQHAMKVWGKPQHKRCKAQMSEILDNWQTGDAVYFEYHAGDAPSYLKVRNVLQKWRAQATALGVPFFAFTVFREPISFALSHFNYYHASQRKYAGYTHFRQPTEKDFVETTPPSPQCLFLTRTEVAYRTKHRALRENLAQQDCVGAYQAVLHDMDWIGTTDRLDSETFPLLQYVAHLGVDDIDFKQRNKSEKKISVSDLSQASIQHVRNITAWDQEVYERVQHDFSINMFANYDPPLGAAAQKDSN
jgi:hypothetical protein